MAREHFRKTLKTRGIGKCKQSQIEKIEHELSKSRSEQSSGNRYRHDKLARSVYDCLFILDSISASNSQSNFLVFLIRLLFENVDLFDSLSIRITIHSLEVFI